MATLVCEALEIITDSGLGVPVSYSNTAIGLATDGHFYLITDRPTISVVTGDTTRTVWYAGILTREFGNWTLSRNIDFVEAGAFEQVSDFTVGIKNTSDFRNTLQANGVYLGRRRVKYYRATSTNGTTWNFELRWTGIIDDQPFNEKTFSLRCLDVSKDIFGTLPPAAVNATAFEDAPKDSLDKMIPVAIGYAGYSPLINVKKAGIKTVLSIIDGVEYEFGACLSGTTGRTVKLKTNGITFSANDSRLVGKYLSQIDGDQDQTLRIGSNLATNYSDPSNPYTQLTLDDALTGTPILWTIVTGTTRPWIFEVIDIAPTLLASNRPVSEIVRNGQGRAALATYSTDLDRFDDVSEINALSSESNIDSTGFPGYSVKAKAVNQSGDVLVPVVIRPESVKLAFAPVSGTFGAVGDDLPNLYDQDESTFYSLTTTTVLDRVRMDIKIPKDKGLKDYESFYVVFNYSQYAVGTPATIELYVTATAIDIYGRSLTTSCFLRELQGLGAPVGTTVEYKYFIPRIYFNEPEDATADAEFHNYKSNLLVGVSGTGENIYHDAKVASFYEKIQLEFEIRDVFGGEEYHFQLYEVGIVAMKRVNVTSETIHGALRGEVYGNTMDGRVSATDYPFSAVRALEYLIRNYDEDAPAWQAATAYEAGDMVRATADNGQVFVCTVAGTSHATTEPTWTDTEGATYADGAVTWKQHHEIPIDTAQFDSANGNRGLWLVGRTLTEKKKSLDYYRTLLEQSFLLGTMTPAGKVQVKAWLQNTTPVIAFSESNILQGTLGDVVLTPVRRMYNDLRVKYDKNPASGTFNKQITVTQIDKPSFPGASETVTGSTRLKWKDFVTGILNYATARDLWEQCHNSYLVTMAVNKLPDELGACEWFFDIYATDPNGKYLWSTDGGETPEYDLGDVHAAVGFVEALANWTAWQKKQVTFETIDNATFSAVRLGDCVSFSDSKLTTGSTLTGWIHEKTQLPRDERRPERFRWGITLYPEALSTYTPPGIIEEHGATDIIDEHGAAGTDIIEEHGA